MECYHHKFSTDFSIRNNVSALNEKRAHLQLKSSYRSLTLLYQPKIVFFLENAKIWSCLQRNVDDGISLKSSFSIQRHKSMFIVLPNSGVNNINAVYVKFRMPHYYSGKWEDGIQVPRHQKFTHPHLCKHLYQFVCVTQKFPISAALLKKDVRQGARSMAISSA